MAHNLQILANGEASFAYNAVNGQPWHTLGKPVPGAMTVKEGLKLGGCDFHAEKRALVTADEDRIVAPDNHMVVRTDTKQCLGVVGNRYEVVQMSDALDFFDAAIGEDTAAIDTVGMLNKGRTGFLLAKMNECVEIVPGDVVDRYLMFTNSFDGSSPVQCLFTGIRVVCQNTMNASLQGTKNIVKIRHTKNAKNKLAQAHLILNENENYWQRMTAALRYFQKRDVTREEVELFTAKLFPGTKQDDGTFVASKRTQNRREAIFEAFETSLGHELAGKTAYGLYNALTWFIDHEGTLREGTDRFEASILGSGEKLRQKGFNILTGLVATSARGSWA